MPAQKQDSLYELVRKRLTRTKQLCTSLQVSERPQLPKSVLTSTTPLSTLRRTKEGQPPREMIRLTLRALGEGEEEIEPATDGGQCPVAVFFSVGEVARSHTQENTASDDGAARARNALRNDRALALL